MDVADDAVDTVDAVDVVVETIVGAVETAVGTVEVVEPVARAVEMVEPVAGAVFKVGTDAMMIDAVVPETGVVVVDEAVALLKMTRPQGCLLAELADLLYSATAVAAAAEAARQLRIHWRSKGI